MCIYVEVMKRNTVATYLNSSCGVLQKVRRSCRVCQTAAARLKQTVTKCFSLTRQTWGGTSGPTWFASSQLSLCGQSKCRRARWRGRWQTGSLSRHQIECFWLDRRMTEWAQSCVVSETVWLLRGRGQRKRRERSKGRQEDRRKMNWQRKRYKSCLSPCLDSSECCSSKTTLALYYSGLMRITQPCEQPPRLSLFCIC